MVDAAIVRAKLATAGDTVTLTRDEANALREAAVRWLDPDAPVPPDGLDAIKDRAADFATRWAKLLGTDGDAWADKRAPFMNELDVLCGAIIAAEREACAKLAISVVGGFGFSQPAHIAVATKIAERIRARSRQG